jgi:hypothetical protein
LMLKLLLLELRSKLWHTFITGFPRSGEVVEAVGEREVGHVDKPAAPGVEELGRLDLGSML